MIERQHEGKSVGFCQSEDISPWSTADTNADGTIRSRICGAYQGERNNPHVAQILVRVLNAKGGDWIYCGPGERDGPIDCILEDRARLDITLEVQVVRAFADKSFYQELARAPSIDEVLPARQIARRLQAAVAKKKEHLPADVRCDLVLALDATKLSACAMASVIEAYQSEFGSWTQSLHFKQVWLLGPMESMSHQLDE